MWRVALPWGLARLDEVTPGSASKARAGLSIGLPGPAGGPGARAARIQCSGHDGYCYASSPDTMFPAPPTLPHRWRDSQNPSGARGEAPRKPLCAELALQVSRFPGSETAGSHFRSI